MIYYVTRWTLYSTYLALTIFLQERERKKRGRGRGRERERERESVRTAKAVAKVIAATLWLDATDNVRYWRQQKIVDT